MKTFLSMLLLAFLLTSPFLSRSDAETVAVLDFKSLLADEELGVAVAEILKTELAGQGEYTIIERGMLEQILEEQALQLSGAVDTDTAVKIGKLVGANVVVTGSIVKTGEMYTINSRFIDVETGIVKIGQNIRGQGENQISNMVQQLALIITGKAVVTEELGAGETSDSSEPAADKSSETPEKPENNEVRAQSDADAPASLRVPQILLEACAQLEEGKACKVKGPRGRSFEATCHTLDGRLACLMTREDAPKKLRDHWEKLDRNRNGFLDLTELPGRPARPGGGSPPKR